MQILVLGKSRAGKSAIINSFAQRKVAKEGVTTNDVNRDEKVCMYKFVQGSKEYSIWELSILQDSDQHDSFLFQQLRSKMERSTTINLAIYCISMNRDRIEKSEVEAIHGITKYFGPEIWKHTIFALTFANRTIPPTSCSSIEDEIAWFNTRVSEFNSVMEKALKCDLSDSCILVVPTGYHTPSRSMPDVKGFYHIEDWFEEFWKICCIRAQQKPLEIFSQNAGKI